MRGHTDQTLCRGALGLTRGVDRRVGRFADSGTATVASPTGTRRLPGSGLLMPNTITLKQHDLSPARATLLFNGTGVNEGPINLTGATAVASVIRPSAAAPRSGGTCTVIDPLVGWSNSNGRRRTRVTVGNFYQGVGDHVGRIPRLKTSRTASTN